MTCKICGNPTKLGTGNFKHRQNTYCSHACVKRACYLRNKTRYDEAHKQWLVEHPERRKEISKKYTQANKEYYAQYRSAYRYRLMKATPSWANMDDIIDVYKEASYMGLEVDHIIPLKHPLVCGLHVWNNLQLLTRSENARKSNKFDIDVLALIKETE